MGNTSSDGNLVNVGNFDRDGVNVNNDQPDNSNGNLGVVLSRNFLPASSKGLLTGDLSITLPVSI